MSLESSWAMRSFMSSSSSTVGSLGGAVDWDWERTFFNLFRFDPAMSKRLSIAVVLWCETELLRSDPNQ